MQDPTQPARFRLAVRTVQAIVIAIVLCVLACGLRASAAESKPDPLVELLGQVDDAAVQLDVLRGMQHALAGRRGVPMPANWTGTAAKLAKSPNAEVRSTAQALSVIYGDRQALESVRATVANTKAPLD